MSLWKIAWRSIQQRAFVSMLTAFSMGLGVALVVSVLVTYGVVAQSFHRGGEGYDLIVGAKGGREQLILNTVFYLSQPIGNIPSRVYDELLAGKYANDIEAAIPVCMGHTYQGFRVIGTLPEMFTQLKYRGDQSYVFAKGENFKAENYFDAVMGSTAAAGTELNVGETFQIIHAGQHAHKEKYKLVGILAPTGTPVDRAVFVNMESIYAIHAAEDIAGEVDKLEHAQEAGKEAGTEHGDAKHAHDADKKPAADHQGGAEHKEGDEHGEHHHHGEREITAILVCVRPDRPAQVDEIKREINDGPDAQAVQPTRVIGELFEGIVGKLEWILLGMAVLTVIVAGISIMVSIYNSMSDRRHEIAVMRALGARRRTVMMIILLESILLSLLGGACGLLLGHGIIWACSPIIVQWTGVVVGLLHFQWVELILIPGLIVLASMVGYLPALAAYRTDVARALTNTP